MGPTPKLFIAAAKFISAIKKAKVTRRDGNVKLTQDTFWMWDLSMVSVFSASCQVTEPPGPRIRSLCEDLISQACRDNKPCKLIQRVRYYFM